MTPRTPETCPICGSPWKGGCQVPGEPLPLGLRVFYVCGASVSVQVAGGYCCNVTENHGSYHMLIKNCTNDETDVAPPGV